MNAAGVLITKPFAELEPEMFERMIAVNLLGPYHWHRPDGGWRYLLALRDKL